ncbi:hypothetical protein KOW79_021359 [Hemibagrus wyckioides]|uniref:Uncharacterized protein n=1 Tax=Hemibagrus wyckioides TaxID=337641 RepID=A0A9D3N3E9_9TELE|nr:hypothetical protein KOW79_021359 [Hemibagrus wyckioides]
MTPKSVQLELLPIHHTLSSHLHLQNRIEKSPMLSYHLECPALSVSALGPLGGGEGDEGLRRETPRVPSVPTVIRLHWNASFGAAGTGDGGDTWSPE